MGARVCSNFSSLFFGVAALPRDFSRFAVCKGERKEGRGVGCREMIVFIFCGSVKSRKKTIRNLHFFVVRVKTETYLASLSL